MINIERQRGMTTIGWLIVLLLIGFFALTTVRLTPAYLEYYSVATTLKSVQEEPGIKHKTKPNIYKLIRRRFEVNNIKTIKAEDVTIKYTGGSIVLTAKYEIRQPLIGNIDVVTRFNKSVEILVN